MKKTIAIVAALGAWQVLWALAPGEYNMNADWRFSWTKGPLPLSNAVKSMEKGSVAVTAPGYDDSDWERVSVPHPVNAHDSFDDHAVDAGEATFKRDMMFYRKRFTLDAAPAGKAFLTFETVRQTIYVWVNGSFLGYYEAGIAPTAYDATALLKSGENTIVVATDNTAQRGSKYFNTETIPGHEPGDGSGQCWQWNTTDFNEVQGGLVGDVKLVIKRAKTYLTLPYYNNLKTQGAYVTADSFDFAQGKARLKVRAEVRNESGAEVKCAVKVQVADAATGKVVATFQSAETPVAAASDAGKTFKTSLEDDVYAANPAKTAVNEPECAFIAASGTGEGLVFWSPDTPHLYDVTVSLVSGGKTLDETVIRTGWREVTFNAEEGGLKINGKNVWLPGYAQRSTDEWAAIGIPPQWLQDYDAALIRRSNANFVRWMHVAPKPAPVRAFDKFGIVNAAPAGDKEGDTSGRAWAQRVEAMRDVIIYFRNSPSIVFWEAGNNQLSPEHMKEMVELKKALDPDGWRFMGSRTLQTKEQVAEAEYVGTMLHRHEVSAFEAMGAIGKYMPIMETEYARQESPRRAIDDFTPPDFDYRGKYLNGGKKESGYDVYDQTQEDFALSTAKEYAQFYSSRNSGQRARTYTCCAALCWTDSNQHGRNSFSENCRSSGRVDAVRLPKENFDVFRVMQSEDPAVMLVGHWSYPKLTADNYLYPVKKYNGHFMEETGEMAQRDPLHKTVYAIASAHAASVELLVNGKSKGVCSKPENIFIYSFPGVDVTEAGEVQVIARDAEGNEIARATERSFSGPGKVKTKVRLGPKGWLADGADLAVIDFALVDSSGTVHPFATGRIDFTLTGDAKFMGGWNSGTYGETSPIGKNFVNLECGRARVFVKAARTPGKVVLGWKYADGQTGTVELTAKEAPSKGGILAGPQQEFPPNAHTFARKTSAPAIQDLAAGAGDGVKYKVFVNGTEVKFPKKLGAPVKPDDATGVCCAYEPVLAAMKAAGAKLEYSVEPKRIPASKKWLRDLSPTPYVPLVTVEADGRVIDACVGFTELFLDNGKEKNLTNCEIYRARNKSPIVCGELVSLVGYIPGVEMTTDPKTSRVDIVVK